MRQILSKSGAFWGRSAAKATSYALVALVASACAPKFNRLLASINPVSSGQCDSVMSPQTVGGALFCPMHASTTGNPTLDPGDANNLVIAGYGDNKIHVICDTSVGAGAGTGICSSVSGTDVVATGGIAGDGGTAYVVAGTGYPVNSGDGGTAANAGFYKPTATAVDQYGNVVITAPTYHTVRVVCLSSSGMCSGVDMTGTYIQYGSGTAATPGNVYMLAGKKAASDSTHSTNTAYGFSGDGGPAYFAQLNLPKGLAIDHFNNVIIADTNNARIRVICFSTSGVCATVAGGSPTLGDIYTLAGGGTTCDSSAVGDGCVASTNSILSQPVGVAVDSSNNVAIADAGNFRIRIICTATSGLCAGSHVDSNYTLNASGPSSATAGDIYTATGTGSTGNDVVGGASNQSSVTSMVAGVGFDSNDNLFVSDPGNSVATVVCAGTSGVCASTSGSQVTSTGSTPATAYQIYSLDDSGSASDMFATTTGVERRPAGIGFNYATHVIGFSSSSNTVIVSDRDNNIVRYMAY